MQQWVEWASGPVFRACFTIMILGLLRVLILNIVSMISLIRSSARHWRKVAWMQVWRATWQWVFPVRKGLKQRTIFGITSMLFHVGAIITPIFLSTHILLWERGLGIRWPAISNVLADYLTLIAIFTGLALFAERISARASRSISRAQDFMLPLLIVIPFATGYLAMHPRINPFDYELTMFLHVMSANLIFLLIPFTKLSHMILFPGTQLVSELGWHLQQGSGRQVAVALHKENEPI